jgi:hypothetical protein
MIFSSMCLAEENQLFGQDMKHHANLYEGLSNSSAYNSTQRLQLESIV